MTDYFNNSEILTILRNRGKHLAIIGIVAIVVSCFISSKYVMKPKFKSTAVLYPSNLTSYGEESTTEQLLELLGSEEIRKQLIKRFDLGTHYKLDTTDQYFQTYVRAKLKENLSISKTEYEAVEVEVIDNDPELAYKMVNEIIRLLDETVRSMHRRKYAEVYEIQSRQYQLKQKEIDSLELVVQELRTKYGLLDFAIQAKEATRGYYRGSSKAADVTSVIRNLEQKGEAYIASTFNLNSARQVSVELKTKMEEAYRELTKEQSFTDIVTAPRVADKKFWPVRWLVVTVFTLSSLFASLMFFLFADYKGNKKPIIKDVKHEEAAVLS